MSDLSDQNQSVQSVPPAWKETFTLLESAPDGVLATDVQTRIIAVNQAICQISGYSREKLLSMSIADLEVVETPEHVASHAQAMRARGFDRFRSQWRRADGRIIDVDVGTTLTREGDAFIAFVRDISELLDSQRRLEDTRLAQYAILDAADETIAMVGVDGRIININRVGAARFGKTPIELIGNNIFELMPTAVASSRRAAIEQVAASGQSAQLIDERDGRLYRSHIYAVPGGQPRVVIYASDITDINAAERALRESRQRLEIALAAANESIWEWNFDTGAIHWSPEFYHSLGYAEGEFVACLDEWLAHVHPDDREPALATVRAQLANGSEAIEAEYRIRTRSGEWRWLLGRGKVIERAADGHPLLLAGTNIDVTERKRAEEVRIRNAERGLALLRFTEQAASLDERSLLAYGLEEAERLTGSAMGFLHFVNPDQETLSLGLWTARTQAACQALHDNHYPLARAGIWADAFRQRKPVVINDYGTAASPNGLPPGHAHLLRLISVPVIEGGKVKVIAGVGNKATPYEQDDVDFVQLLLTDLWRIVERSRAERELQANLAQQRELNCKLEEAHNQLLQSEKMASIGQLAAGVAHELNNPIGFVHSNLGTLESYLGDIFEIVSAYEAAVANPIELPRVDALLAEKDFGYIKSDIFQLMDESKDGLTRVKKIVQDLKDFSRVGETDWQWADIRHCLDSTLNIVWNELKYKCQVHKDYAADLPQIRCLPSQLNQVFMNLLVNAAQAIAEKGTIAITARLLDGDRIQVRISDSGSGIDPANLNRIFDPFFTTKPVGRGTGLGLSIAYGIIGKHHGKIEVSSVVGEGTTFAVTLPVDPPTLAGDPALQPEATQASP
ncbi:MAG TPA: PAS domain S-box protein [Rhodocyclaceae bacterium]